MSQRNIRAQRNKCKLSKRIQREKLKNDRAMVSFSTTLEEIGLKQMTCNQMSAQAAVVKKIREKNRFALKSTVDTLQEKIKILKRKVGRYKMRLSRLRTESTSNTSDSPRSSLIL